MTPPATTRVVCVACSIFRREIEELARQQAWPFEIQWLDSVLHLYPRHLQHEVDDAMAARPDDRILLLFGDCHAYMLDAARRPGVARVPGINCCEILLGSAEYRRLRREGAFFLLPEWTVRWREILPAALGIPEGEVKNLMAEAHSHLLYLDTGLAPVPTTVLEEASAWTGLPYKTMPVGLEQLRSAVMAAWEKLT